jgi:hypothetical protein
MRLPPTASAPAARDDLCFLRLIYAEETKPHLSESILTCVSIHSYGGPSAGRAGRRASDERGFLSLRIEQSESDLTPTGLAQLLRRPLLYM